ncbi:MAG: sugar kinase [Candidatus Thorarchaeota archaeon]
MIVDAKEVYSYLDKNGVEIELEEKLGQALKKKGVSVKKLDADVIALVGSDKLLLETLLKRGSSDTPILPISSRGQPDFLFDVTVPTFETIVKDLLDHNWTEDRRIRIEADIAGYRTPPLLNDLAIFAKRSATLIRYSLFLDGERFWKDGSDGLIVSTPTGSTAYALSVGGPVILNPANVLSIIPVNSVNPAQRPLILSDSMNIEIRDLSSSVAIEAVLDGQVRRKVDGGPIQIHRSEWDAVFVKLSEERIAALRGKLQRKMEEFSSLAQDLPPSAKLVLKVLEYQGQLTQKEIIDETMLPARTVRYALSLLMSEELVAKRVSLRDSRQGLYRVIKKPERQQKSAKN